MLYTDNFPGKDRPKKAQDADGAAMSVKVKGGAYKALYTCPNCGQNHTTYEKEYKGKMQVRFSCMRPSDKVKGGSELNCGYWTVWDKE